MLACTPCTVNMSDADIHGIVRHRPVVNPLIRLRVFAAACIFLCGFSVTLKAFLCHSARHQLKQRSHRLRLRAAPYRMLRWLFSLQHGARAKSQLGQRKSCACTNLHNCFAEKGVAMTETVMFFSFHVLWLQIASNICSAVTRTTY